MQDQPTASELLEALAVFLREDLAEGHRQRLVDDDAEGPIFGAVLAEQGHRLREIGVVERGHRNE